MAKEEKSVLYGQPTQRWNRPGRKFEYDYPVSHCDHTWSYHFVDREYRQCRKCDVIERVPVSVRTG